jgi:hypothetical protein
LLKQLTHVGIGAHDQEALKGRGVEFQQEPTEQPYGLDAGFRDTSGNQMRVMQTQ